MRKVTDLLGEIIDVNNFETANDLALFTKKHKFSISEERYVISSDEESRKYNKSIGEYHLLDIPNILDLDKKGNDYAVGVIAKSLEKLIGTISNKSRILIVGLGNRHISSDSLGTKVVSKIIVNSEYRDKPKVMAFCPSVLGLTGMETYDIVKGVIDSVMPTHLVLIDSLCASSVSRLGRSIQLSNTGICPGSGVGNKRKCLDKNLCKNVVSIGIPLLIFASTFLDTSFETNGLDYSTIQSLMQKYKKSSNNVEIVDFLEKIKNIYNENFDGVIVSVKDIDELVCKLSDVLAEAINKTLGFSKEIRLKG